MEWQCVTVTTTTQCADLVSLLLIEAGSDGVRVVDKQDVTNVLKSDKSWDYADDSLINFSDERVFVSGFFVENFSLEQLFARLDELKSNCEFECGSLEVSASKVKSADWENEWKKHYRPIEIEGVAIVPKWLRYDGKCLPVLMDPGMAFGTGNHETTAMCLRLMQHIDLKQAVVADVGCGSGILGVTALKLGAKRCVLTDIDKQAVTATMENALLNGVSERAEIYCGDLAEAFTGKADVVLANLTADILLRLHEMLGGVIRRGGSMIISGLIHSRADEVLEAYTDAFELKERLIDGEWQAMRLEAK